MIKRKREKDNNWKWGDLFRQSKKYLSKITATDFIQSTVRATDTLQIWTQDIFSLGTWPLTSVTCWTWITNPLCELCDFQGANCICSPDDLPCQIKVSSPGKSLRNSLFYAVRTQSNSTSVPIFAQHVSQECPLRTTRCSANKTVIYEPFTKGEHCCVTYDHAHTLICSDKNFTHHNKLCRPWQHETFLIGNISAHGDTFWHNANTEMSVVGAFLKTCSFALSPSRLSNNAITWT